MWLESKLWQSTVFLSRGHTSRQMPLLLRTHIHTHTVHKSSHVMTQNGEWACCLFESRKQQWRADLYHLASCVYSGVYFWPSVFTQLNIDSDVYRCLRFEPKTKCSASSWAERWMFVCDLIPPPTDHPHHETKKKFLLKIWKQNFFASVTWLRVYSDCC